MKIKDFFKKKKNMTLMAVLLALAVLSVGVSFSYLTAKSDVVVNTFAGGSIALTLDEAETDTSGNIISTTRVSSNTYKYVPGSVLSKDPTVTVLEDSEECYVFLYMDNPLPSEYFTLDISDSWTVISTDGDGILYVYKTTIDAADEDVVLDALFTTVTVSTELTSEDVEELGSQQITLQAFAVQAEGVDTTTAYDLAVSYFNETFSVSFKITASEEAEAETDEAEDEEETSVETNDTEKVETSEETDDELDEEETSEELDEEETSVKTEDENLSEEETEISEEEAEDDEETETETENETDMVITSENFSNSFISTLDEVFEQ